MNPFQKMIDDVFNCPAFRETAIINDTLQIPVIRYTSSESPVYTEFGVESGITMQLTCKVKDYSPKKGDRISFDGKMYKVDQFNTDSFNLSYILQLKEIHNK